MSRLGRNSLPLVLLPLSLFGCTMREMIYPAPPIEVPSPPPPPLEEVRISIPSAEVTAWHLPLVAAPGRPAILFLHGNGENLETMRLSGTFDLLGALDGPVLALDYPGYGRSGGRASEESVKVAGRAALDWLQQRHPNRPVVVVGWSLGAAVAVSLAAERPGDVNGLVALSPWTSLAAVAKRHFPGFLVGVLLRESYDSLAAARSVEAPALVIHGARDEIIPTQQGRDLAEALGADCGWLEVATAAHNDLLSEEAVWQSLRSFLDAL